jgi:hypothetical protein
VVGAPCAFRAGVDAPGARLSGLNATALSTSVIELTWAGIDNATHYWVYAVSNSNVYTTLASALEGVEAFNVTGLAEATQYQFRVLPGNATDPDTLGAGAAARTLLAPPSVPAPPPGAVGSDFVALSWSAGSNLTAYFVVFVSPPLVLVARRSVVPPPGYGLLLNYTTDTSFNATGLLPGTTYSFLIGAAGEDLVVDLSGPPIVVVTNAAPTLAPTTPAPTTAVPTTPEPTTVAPTTVAPTTVVPTTVVPTTAVPTTAAPTTAGPTTAVPTTAVPTTAVPTTAVPTTASPTTAAPTTAAPTTAAPTTAAPTTAAPTTAAPTTPVPTTQTPTTPVAPAARTGPNAGAVVGGLFGALILLILLGFLFIFFMRRRQRSVPNKHAQLSEDRGSEMSLAATAGTDGDGGIALPDATVTAITLRSHLIAPNPLAVSAQHTNQAEVVAKVLEGGAPAVLLLNPSTDLRVDAAANVGSTPNASKGTLYDIAAIQRNGAAACLVTPVPEVENESEDDRARRLRREVAILWALAVHANVSKLIGFSESPPQVITKFYPTDLFRYLFGQADKAPFDPHISLHICSGMASALAVVHHTGMAHRCIQASSFRLQPPAQGTLFPDPVLGDFGYARVGYVKAAAAWRYGHRDARS